MTQFSSSSRIFLSAALCTLLAASGAAWAQDQDQTGTPVAGGWRRAGTPATATAPGTSGQTQDPTEPVDRSDQYGQPGPQAATPPAAPSARLNDRPAYGLPAQLTLRPGTFLNVRVNDPLSSDRNQVGDPFTASLTQPIVVDGVVVAQRGQALYGRVAEVVKQHSGNPSRLGLELTSLTLADGTQVPVRSQLVARQGGTTPAGQQAATVAGTTAVGAAIGAAADWGTGAAIGAGAGAAAGIVGVLLTRNHATVVYPETALTFRVDTPVTVSTLHAPQAFRFVGPEDYDRPNETRTVQVRPHLYGYPAPYYSYYDPYYSYYPYSYWGPRIGFGWSSGYYWGGGYRGHRR